MSRRESRDSHSRRLRSRSEREPSPRGQRRDGKPAMERRSSSSRYLEVDNTYDRDQKRSRRVQDVPVVEPPTTKVDTDLAKGGTDVKEHGPSDGTKHPSDPLEVQDSRSYVQHDERNSAGQGGRNYVRRANDHERRGHQKEQSDERVKDKRSELRGDDDKVWRHDGYFQLEAETPSKKRPAFSEKKMSAEQVPVATVTVSDFRPANHEQHVPGAARRDEREAYYSRGLDRPERPSKKEDERNDRWNEGSIQRSEARRSGYPPRERFGGRGMRGRDRYSSRYGGRIAYHQGNDQVEKWKHDMFDEANRSPTPKNEEDHIAKVEALLAL